MLREGDGAPDIWAGWDGGATAGAKDAERAVGRSGFEARGGGVHGAGGAIDDVAAMDVSLPDV